MRPGLSHVTSVSGATQWHPHLTNCTIGHGAARAAHSSCRSDLPAPCTLPSARWPLAAALLAATVRCPLALAATDSPWEWGWPRQPGSPGPGALRKRHCPRPPGATSPYGGAPSMHTSDMRPGSLHPRACLGVPGVQMDTNFGPKVRDQNADNVAHSRHSLRHRAPHNRHSHPRRDAHPAGHERVGRIRAFHGLQVQWPTLRDSADKRSRAQARSYQHPSSLSAGLTWPLRRPGDIAVVAALGDSITAALGASSKTLLDIGTEWRGESWSIGGAQRTAHATECRRAI